MYGITRPAQTWNPIKINFQHIFLLIRDAIFTSSWKDKLRIWIMPTGWRPTDMEKKYPVYKITDVYNFEKYNPRASTALHAWCWFQLLSILILISYFFGNLATIGSPMIFYYGAFIFISIYALTELMDRNPYALIWEGVKNAFGYYLLTLSGDWFGASKFVQDINYVMTFYFLTSFAVTIYFVLRHYREDHATLPATAQ